MSVGGCATAGEQQVQGQPGTGMPMKCSRQGGGPLERCSKHVGGVLEVFEACCTEI